MKPWYTNNAPFTSYTTPLTVTPEAILRFFTFFQVLAMYGEIEVHVQADAMSET